MSFKLGPTGALIVDDTGGELRAYLQDGAVHVATNQPTWMVPCEARQLAAHLLDLAAESEKIEAAFWADVSFAPTKSGGPPK